ncbi:related to rAsp f 9 allergen [Ramularia collo-cygni]|uniref:Related to rAsp f 9 allergen n=1 Tax=Ramularia collo-cygni TaxID=112498 RepID=A0A2D3USZ3_9PEZI|nr:related to rAsp f 9 allergen [Ramularia collo-cygni]CZT19441.1 related to rAsp f 9 allergen [Ramularia collo-cygni]
MHFSRSTATTALVALLPAYTLAQTFTDCDSTKESCKPEVGLPSSKLISDFTKGKSSGESWSPADGTSLKYGSDGAEYAIIKPGEAPTVGSDFTIFYGTVEVVMKAAHGLGIVSSIVLESSVLDEIDWEFLGSKPTQVQTNYYGLANTTTYDRVGYHDIADTQADFHAYTIDWSPERIDFLVDGSKVRTISRASTEGRNYPQTPMQVKLGNWAAGGPGMAEGTVAWAGGKTNYDDGPFNMIVKSVKITNTNPACSYKYSDKTGSDTSIDIITKGDSCNGGKVAGKTATEGPTLSQTVADIVPTAYINSSTSNGAATSTGGASPSAGTSAGKPNSPSMETFTGGAALHSVGTIVSWLAIAAGLWVL